MSDSDEKVSKKDREINNDDKDKKKSSKEKSKEDRRDTRDKENDRYKHRKRRHRDSGSETENKNEKDKKPKDDSDVEKPRDRKNNEKSRYSRDYDRRPRSRYYKEYTDYDRPKEDYPRYYGNNEEEENKNRDRRYKDRSIDRQNVGPRYYDEEAKKKKNETEEGEIKEDKAVITPRQRKTVDLLTSKTGGAYIPPAKLRMMQAEITDKSSAAYQRIAWEALKKSIHGFINKVNTGNIGLITRDLLRENIVRGRGLLCKSLIQAQAASPTFTHVYAALVSVINSKFPSIGELLLKRLVLQFKRGFKRNDKTICISASAFVAHLVNQRVAHEILALEILTLLVESPTDDSVEVAIAFLKECGQKLTEVSSKGTNAIFEMLRNILHEGQLEKRIQYMIEVMFQVRKDGFKDHAAVIEELDIVEEEDQFTHLITLDDVKSGEDILSKLFLFPPKFVCNQHCI